MVEPIADAKGDTTAMQALARIFRIQPGEGKTVAVVVGLMAVSVASLTIGESGINALFFDRVGANELPTMFLLQGAVGIAGMLVLSGLLGRFDRRRAYVALPLVLAAAVAVERAILTGDAAWIYRALWLTITLAYLLQSVYLWGTAGLVTDTRRAKRLFPLFGAGSILGAVIGGLATTPLAAIFGAENLLIVWAVGLVTGSALCAAVLGVRRREHRPRHTARRTSALAELRQGFGFVRRSPLLIWMSVASVLFSLLFYSLYQPFAAASADRFPDPDALAGFFGLFWAGVTGVAFLVSVLLANRLLGWFGAAAMIVVLPVLYLGAFGVLLAASTFAMLVALRFGVNVWLQGVTSPSWETLINVTPEHRRDQSRAFLNGGPAQVGTAIAGLILLLGQDALTARQLSLIGLVVALATVWVTWRIRRSYTAALVDAIRAGRPRVFDDAVRNSPVAIRGDALAVTLAIGAMGDEDARVRRLAAELLETADDPRATEMLRAALGDEDAIVRATAVRGLGASDAFGADELESALADADPAVRRAAILVAPSDGITLDLLHDQDGSVVAAAAGRLLGGRENDAAAAAFERLLADEDIGGRVTALIALAGSGEPEEIGRLAFRVLDDPYPSVHAAAVGALGSAGPEVGIPAALEALARPDPAVRAAGRAALRRLDLHGHGRDLASVVEHWSTLALTDGATAAAIAGEHETEDLLRAALASRARDRAMVALSAATVASGDPASVDLALDVLSERSGGELANALETIEVSAPSTRPLLALWEPTTARTATDGDGAAVAAHDEDPFIRACAELVRSTRDRGGPMARTRGSMSPIELVLVLRGIPLFAALEPAELQRIAAIAGERTYADGEVIGAEGDVGDEMHVIVEGTVRIVRGEGTTIARRGPGDIVGEMAVITRASRVATLVAEGDVRSLRIGHREFEGMVRERPEIALAVMRVLAERLGAASEPAPEPA